MNEPIIEVKNLTKIFKLPHEKYSTAKQHFVNIFNRGAYEKFKALEDVSFEIQKGEFFGIIGANGSGKSTLLKIMAGIYQPTGGSVAINGSLSPFIELGVGFNPELTARENIFLNAAILGLSKKQTEEKFDEIVDFSELRNFLDQKLKNFSSGMQVRLAFSIAIQAHADILLIDEVLAVGDQDFQEKCLKVFRDLKKQKKTIVFVSHGLSVMEEYCDRIMFIKNGDIKMIGTPNHVILNYLRQTGEKQLSEEKDMEENEENSAVKVKAIKFFTNEGKETKIIQTYNKMEIKILFYAKEKVKNPVFGLAIYREDGLHITGPNTKTSEFKIDQIEGNGFITYTVEKLPLMPGTFNLTVGVFDSENKILDFIEKGTSFKVISNLSNKHGTFKFEENWKLG